MKVIFIYLTNFMSMSQLKFNIIVVLGPTASGKTAFAAAIAKEYNGEIISADSRQVYRNLNLGTGKDYQDYLVEGYKVPYHLIDIKPAGYQYNIYEYQGDFVKAFTDIQRRNKLPILCGGSGLYIESAIQGFKLIHVPVNEQLRKDLEPKTLEELTELLSHYKRLHNTTDVDTKKRAIRAIEIEEYYLHHEVEDSDYPKITPLLVGVRFDRDTERKRITQRLEQRLNEGMVEEVKQLLDSGLTPNQLIYYGLEYKFLSLYLTQKLSYNEMFTLLNTAIHQFAKRQMTWFRRMERNGMNIHWIDGALPIQQKLALIKTWI